MFETIASKELYQDTSYLVTVDSYQLPEDKAGTILQIHHPGGAAVLAMDASGRIPLVRQYRYAVKRTLLEIPAGKLDKISGETPEDGALRELREETGCEADQVVPLGCIYPSPGIDTEVLYLFAAKVVGRATQELDEDEFIDVLWVSPSEFQQMIGDGRINDAKTICAWSRALLRGLISLS
ncbi:MAG: NUDIX hydrolase [Sphaerochaetaceae bacterium]|nr:NUDIX hydrolase [Spirochaetales bacterium]MDY5500062.1 NUDIX hydrolase [Sphaerochaetaceae bacterium]